VSPAGARAGHAAQHSTARSLLVAPPPLRSLYNNIKAPSQLQPSATYYLFKDGIQPKWEDPKNANGGCWTATVPRTPNANQLLDAWWLHLVRGGAPAGGDRPRGGVGARARARADAAARLGAARLSAPPGAPVRVAANPRAVQYGGGGQLRCCLAPPPRLCCAACAGRRRDPPPALPPSLLPRRSWRASASSLRRGTRSAASASTSARARTASRCGPRRRPTRRCRRAAARGPFGATAAALGGGSRRAARARPPGGLAPCTVTSARLSTPASPRLTFPAAGSPPPRSAWASSSSRCSTCRMPPRSALGSS
jgi:hypothetical protein